MKIKTAIGLALIAFALATGGMLYSRDKAGEMLAQSSGSGGGGGGGGGECTLNRYACCPIPGGQSGIKHCTANANGILSWGECMSCGYGRVCSPTASLGINPGCVSSSSSSGGDGDDDVSRDWCPEGYDCIREQGTPSTPITPQMANSICESLYTNALYVEGGTNVQDVILLHQDWGTLIACKRKGSVISVNPAEDWLIYQQRCQETGGSLKSNTSCHDLCTPSPCFTSETPRCDCGPDKCWDTVGCIEGKGGQESIQAASSGNLDVTCSIDKEIKPGESFEVDLMASTNTRFGGLDAKLQVAIKQAISGLLNLLREPVRSTHYQGTPPPPPGINSIGALIHDDSDIRFSAPGWTSIAHYAVEGFKQSFATSWNQKEGHDAPNPAVWSFGEIIPGKYAVYATWPASSAALVNEGTYSFVEEGIDPVTIASVNQTLSPEEERNQYEGVYWIHIGYIAVRGGRDVQIQLAGNKAKADGVILVPTFNPPHTLGFNCGDGDIQTHIGEQCDDGNKVDGDGCSSSCLITTQCNDGIDNDGDGKADCSDPNCHTDLDASNPDSCDMNIDDEKNEPYWCVLDNADDEVFKANEAQNTDKNYWVEKSAANSYKGTQHSYNAPNNFGGGTIPSANWSCRDLKPGNYDVFVTWGYTNGAKATYRVMDSGADYADRLEVDVDQSTYPQNDSYWEGKRWQKLGEIEVIEGNVSVGVSSNTDWQTGKNIFVADAVRLVNAALRPVCGNGVLEEHEECDDGNGENTDACLDTCVNARCWDRFIEVGIEECDDGNQVNDDGCSNSCLLPSCGDGIVQVGEECDDGNSVNTDSCLDSCASATCGDEFVQTGREECDDGNQVNGDGCTSACELPGCGDGIVQAGEECDDGNASNNDACLNACTVALCGDGRVQKVVEECDDAGSEGGDGCSQACEVEDGGWFCSGEPSFCIIGCGNGVVQGQEECDDENNVDNDGCSGVCAIEHGYLCGSATPSSCSRLEPLDDKYLKDKNSRWTRWTSLGGYDGGYSIHAIQANAPSNHEHVWLEIPAPANIGQGDYDVLVTWKDSTSKGTYVYLSLSVINSSGKTSTLLSRTINQKYPPSGTYSNGAAWQNMGTITIGESVRYLRIRFSAPDNKHWTVDAVRLVPVQ